MAYPRMFEMSACAWAPERMVQYTVNLGSNTMASLNTRMNNFSVLWKTIQKEYGEAQANADAIAGKYTSYLSGFLHRMDILARQRDELTKQTLQYLIQVLGKPGSYLPPPVVHPKADFVKSSYLSFCKFTGFAPRIPIKDNARHSEGYGRSYYSEDEDVIYLRSNPFIGTVWHELGHALERKTPGLTEDADAFLKYRSDGAAKLQLKLIDPRPGYRDDEYTYMDSFPDVYIGKHYDHGGTEITSMGLQFIAEDPCRLWIQDRELFYFVIGEVQLARSGKCPWV